MLFSMKKKNNLIVLLLWTCSIVFAQETSTLEQIHTDENNDYIPFFLSEEIGDTPFDEFVNPEPLEKLDSLPPKDNYVNFSKIISPTIMFQPETSLQLGVAYGFYFKSKDPSRVSSIFGSAAYSIKNQFIFQINGNYFSKNGKFKMPMEARFRIFPEKFYGIGADTTGFGEPCQYHSLNFYVQLQPQFYINNKWSAGIWISTMGEWINQNKSELPQDLCGNDKYLEFGLGPIIQYDSRDNIFWPSKGIFFRAGYWYYSTYLGSTYDIKAFNVDARYFVPAFKRKFPSVFAFQLLCEGRLGNNIPFQLLPSIGGRDVLRGQLQNVYRDNIMYAVQAEYRFPIWAFIKGVVFCSIGDVLNPYNFKIAEPKVTFGLGLRFQINQNKTHLRLDFGMNNKWKSGFYFHGVEAF